MNPFRLLFIFWILAYYRIDTLLPKGKLRYGIFFFILVCPFSWFNRPHAARGRRLRLALEKLGPIFVKFGQTLSTRPDLLPEDLIEELEKLQDRVLPFSSKKAVQILEAAYQKKLNEVFLNFNIQPLASASIAQVHDVTLHNGKKAVVKIVRPNIKVWIQRDIALLFFLSRWITYCWPAAKPLRLVEMVKEFKQIIEDELDMLREAANAAKLRSHWEDSHLLYVPQVYWEYCRTHILVVEKINGVRVSDIKTLRKLRVDMKKLAERGVEIFYLQVFRDRFFHADMHSGNIFVDVQDPLNPKYVGVDFGIMGTLDDKDQYYLAQNFLAFFNRDYRKVALLHIESGWVPPNTPADRLESAIRTVCEPIFNKPLSEISFAIVLIRLFQTARRFNMEIQPQLLLLQKTLLNVEGLGRQLYPELNLWETAKPHLQRVMRQQLGWRGIFKNLKDRLPLFLEEWTEGFKPRLNENAAALLNNQIMSLQRQIEEQRSKLIALRRVGAVLFLSIVIFYLFNLV